MATLLEQLLQLLWVVALYLIERLLSILERAITRWTQRPHLPASPPSESEFHTAENMSRENSGEDGGILESTAEAAVQRPEGDESPSGTGQSDC